MKTFQQLVKAIRKSAKLTQVEFAKKLGVTQIYIALIETGKREASKKLVEKLAKLLEVHPMSIAPFIFSDNVKVSKFEQKLVAIAEKLQEVLIEDRAKKLRK